MLLHLTGAGAPFEGHGGLKAQIGVVREGLAHALERFKMLVEVEGSQASHRGVGGGL